MSEHYFGVGPGHLSTRVDKIAKKHGADLVNFTGPRGDKRHWFSCENRGEPFNSATARAVLDALDAAKVKRW